MVRDNRFRDGLQGNTVRGELIMLTSVSKSAPCTSLLSLQVDAEIIGCGSLTCMCIVSLTILLSYLIEGREVVQSTVIDAAFAFIAATLLMTAGGMACLTYNSVFALSGPPTIVNLNISRNSQQVNINIIMFT